MPDAPQPDRPRDDGFVHDLRTWERWVAGGVGVVGVVVGGLGIFWSENQAGTTAILLLGAVFLLMAVQGTTVIKAGKDNLEMGQRRRKALDMSGRAAEALDQKNLETADALQEAAKAIDPSIRSDPSVMAVDDRIYITAVMEAVMRSMDRWAEILKARGEERFFTVGMIPTTSLSTFYMTITDDGDSSRNVTVVIRRWLQPPNSMSLTYVNVLDVVEGLTGNVLIVSESGPSKLVIDKVRSILAGRVNLEVVRWVNAVDDPVLQSSLAKMLQLQ